MVRPSVTRRLTVEIRRFGIGQRRPDGPPGTHNVQGALIDSGPHGVVAELALARHATIEVHSNPNTTWFVVIEGGGFVTVGSDRARVFAGEAVLWPAGVPHGASTELSEMRAIVVEFPVADLALGPGAAIIDAPVLEAGSGWLAGAAWPRATATSSTSVRRPYDPRHGEPR